MHTTGRPGRPPRLSRDKIVATAIEIVTQEGYAKLSMRHLADRLGTSPMGVYYYFESKDELVGSLFSQHDALAGYLRDTWSPTPCERAAQISAALIRFLVDHSWALAGMLDGYVRIEDFTENHLLRELTESVRDLGLDQDDAVETVRGIWRIVLGEAMLESTPVAAGIGPERSAGPYDGTVGHGNSNGARAYGLGAAETVECYLAGRLDGIRSRRPHSGSDSE